MANIKKPDSLQTPSTPKNINKIPAIQSLDDGDGDDDDESPLRPIFCLKRKSAIKEFDDREDCFILDFNPEEDSLDLVEIDRQKNLQDSPDIFLVAERGQVACRDYPHSRHLCVKHPFEKTSHESYCKLCYCFVCDVSAPCKSWSGVCGHCHAIDNEGWKTARKMLRKG
ncbi:hypothetical protein L1987_42961 [Smallanthus sonchifolius]|uniref:Uncharacterized protein n=1 Tax=Smallanthus sonchifolius TaxID=185202 RepID=A0ACB9GKF3_9ASTR|nr:hypothetical protein L1987_42961 [Smallanthus sonchifolius]